MKKLLMMMVIGTVILIMMPMTNFSVFAEDVARSISFVSFTSESNIPIPALSPNGKVKASVTINNTSAATQPAVLLLACYNGNKLEDITFDQKDSLPGRSTTYTAVLTAPNDISNCKFTACVWNDFDNMNILANMASFPNNSCDLLNVSINGDDIQGFTNQQLTYDVLLPRGTDTLPQISAIAKDNSTKVDITQGTKMPGSAKITVSAADQKTTKTFTINYRITPGTVTNMDSQSASCAVKNNLKDNISLIYTDKASIYYKTDPNYTGVSYIQFAFNDKNSSKFYSSAIDDWLKFDIDQSAEIIFLNEVTFPKWTYSNGWSRDPVSTDPNQVITRRLDDPNLLNDPNKTYTGYLMNRITRKVYKVRAGSTAAVTIGNMYDPNMTQAPWGTPAVWINWLTPFQNSELKNVIVNGNEIPDFGLDPNITEYNYQIPWGSSVPVVSAQAAAACAKVEITQVSAVPGTATIIVTPGDGDEKNKCTYKINLSYIPGSNANLKKLSVNGAELPDFNADKLNYHYTMPISSTLPTVSAEAEDPDNTTVNCNQVEGMPGTAIITVSSKDGKFRKQYKVDLEYAVKLKKISVNGSELTEFDADNLEYNYSLLADGNLPVVSAESADPNFTTIAYSQVTSMPGTALITLSSNDGKLNKQYKVNLKYIDQSNVNLEKITVDGNMLPGFNGDTAEYNYTLPYGHAIPTVAAKAESSYATVNCTQVTVIPGTAVITVKSMDQLYTKQYKVNFSYIPGSNVNLNNIFVDGNAITGFDPNVLQYNIKLPAGTSVVPTITALAAIPAEVTVTVNAAAALPGDTTITVSSPDGKYSKQYKVNLSVIVQATINQAPSEDTFAQCASPTATAKTTTPLIAKQDGNDGGFSKITYFKFNLSAAVPSNAKIIKAELLYEVTYVAGSNVQLSFRPVADSWSDATLNWNNKPAYGATITTQTITAVGSKSVDLTDYVKSEFSLDKIVSIAVRDDAPNYSEVRFNSVEATDTAVRPYLKITYEQ